PTTSAPRCVFIRLPAVRSFSCWRSWWRSAGGAELGRPRQSQQPLAIDVLLEMVGQRVERGFDLALVTQARARATDPLQPLPALAIVGQQAMDVAEIRRAHL